MPDLAESQLITKYAVLVAVNPLAQMVFSPLIGWIVAKLGRVRPVLIAASLSFVLAYVIYSLVSLAPVQYRFYALLVARAVMGASAGNLQFDSSGWKP